MKEAIIKGEKLYTCLEQIKSWKFWAQSSPFPSKVDFNPLVLIRCKLESVETFFNFKRHINQGCSEIVVLSLQDF